MTQKTKPAPQDADVKAALDGLTNIQTEAKAELETFENVQSFKMESAAKDKNGENTKVLIVDVKSKGVLQRFVRSGNPIAPSETGMDTDEDSLAEYMAIMANIDLETDEALEAAGIDAVTGARDAVAGYFMLRALTGLNLREAAKAA